MMTVALTITAGMVIIAVILKLIGRVVMEIPVGYAGLLDGKLFGAGVRYKWPWKTIGYIDISSKLVEVCERFETKDGDEVVMVSVVCRMKFNVENLLKYMAEQDPDLANEGDDGDIDWLVVPKIKEFLTFACIAGDCIELCRKVEDLGENLKRKLQSDFADTFIIEDVTIEEIRKDR
jgi:hypothetical protein